MTFLSSWTNLFLYAFVGCSCNIQIFRATVCFCSVLHANCCFCFECQVYYPVSMCTEQVILKTFLKKSNFIFIKLFLCSVDNYRIICFFLNSRFLTFTKIYISLSRFNYSQKFPISKATGIFPPVYSSHSMAAVMVVSCESLLRNDFITQKFKFISSSECFGFFCEYFARREGCEIYTFA